MKKSSMVISWLIAFHGVFAEGHMDIQTFEGGVYLGKSKILQDSQNTIDSINPTTGNLLARLKTGTLDNILEAIEHSQKAHQQWSLVPAPKRALALKHLSKKIQAQQKELASLISLEMGKIFAESMAEVQEMLDMFDFAIGQSRMLYGKTMPSERAFHRLYEQWHPYGVISIFTAFNFPMAVWAWNASLAIIAGNAIIWKPSSQTPLCAIAIHHLCMEVMEELNTPDIFSLVLGESHEAISPLLQDNRIQLVSFTGSCQQGKEIAKIVHERLGQTLLELGGNNAVIIDESANLDLALKHVVFGATATSGQRCTSTRRVFIHQKHYQHFIQKLKTQYEKIKIGNPLDSKTILGPLISHDAKIRYLEAIKNIRDEKGHLLFGGEQLIQSGFFVQPTLVTNLHPFSPIIQQETFAPILYLFPFENFHEAITLQNAVPQGLSSSLFTQNICHAEYFLSARGSDCGIANINTSTAGAEIGMAFGGEKETGGGREAGSDAWKNYMRRQSCTIHWGEDFNLAQGLKI